MIIPVFNDAERLKLCLEALERQTYPKDRYEVIVVDNGSHDSSVEVAESFGTVLLLKEPRPGSYAARNKGIAVAKGGILAFTDSDCIPDSKWLENGLKAIVDPLQCGLAAGRVDLFFKNPEAPTAVEIYESIELDFSQEKLIETQRFGLTANLFTTQKTLEDIGTFNAELKSGGDKDWGKRVFEAGYRQIYAQDAAVKHPARYSWWQLYKRVTRITGGAFDSVKQELSDKDRLKQFAKYIGLAFTPPFRSLIKIRSDGRLKNREQKIQFAIAKLFVRYVIAWEYIRLQLGGRSRRW